MLKPSPFYIVVLLLPAENLILVRVLRCDTISLTSNLVEYITRARNWNGSRAFVRILALHVANIYLDFFFQFNFISKQSNTESYADKNGNTYSISILSFWQGKIISLWTFLTCEKIHKSTFCNRQISLQIKEIIFVMTQKTYSHAIKLSRKPLYSKILHALGPHYLGYSDCHNGEPKLLWNLLWQHTFET